VRGEHLPGDLEGDIRSFSGLEETPELPVHVGWRHDDELLGGLCAADVLRDGDIAPDSKGIIFQTGRFLQGLPFDEFVGTPAPILGGEGVQLAVLDER
jgi:hypothetical protein